MPDMSDHRQLLAIMFTDVVGYTALTERDEAAAVRVRTQHRDLVRTLVEQFEGEVIDATGDESLSIFPSALRAVDCALALQGALRSYPDMRLRIGIHLGDVIRRNGEVVGEGVNVAARIRPFARHPERVSRLVLASTTAGGRAGASPGFDRILRALPLFETDWQTPAVTNIMVDWIAPTAGEVQRRVLGEFLRRSGSGAAIAGFFRALADIDVSEQARHITVPTLVIHARDDQTVPLEAGRALAALIPNVRFEVVEGGHLEGTGGTPEVRARIIKFFDEEPNGRDVATP